MNQSAQPLIQLTDINRFFGSGDNRAHVLKSVDLSIESGEFIAIIGQSGSGKSTLMNILGCLDSASSGRYTFDGKEIATLNVAELATLRRQKFGFIFQRYNLLSALTALDNVALPAVYSGMAKKARQERAQSLLQELGLSDKGHHKPTELSGGQQQRVSIARALMNGGEVILADEPTGALDSASGEKVMAILQQLHQAGHTLILVTHDANVADYANRIIEIKDGRIISDKTKGQPHVPKNVQAIKPRRGLGFLKDQFSEAFSMSIQAILSHKLRSLLTMLGIIIGIASVVSVVALGKGSQEKILNDINQSGNSTISIYPGKGFGDRNAHRIKTLSADDAEALTKQPYIDSATPQASTQGTLIYKNNHLSAILSGVGAQSFRVQGLTTTTGRIFTEQEVKSVAQVVVINTTLRDKLFANSNPLGQVLLFNKCPLKIIGVAQSASARQDKGLQLWIPYTSLMQRITGNKTIEEITVKAASSVNTQVAEKSLTELLTARHGRKDFFTFNSSNLEKMVKEATSTMTLLVSSIAVISLIVGGIGVMNIMLVSVTERTKEIGIRMAIGARQSNILQQFLIEAILICMIGGVLGVGLSYGISLLFNHVVSAFAMSFSSASIVAAVLCSTIIGTVFGYIPARNASRLAPVDALSKD